MQKESNHTNSDAPIIGSNITIVLFVYNEEKRIRFFLEAVKKSFPIIVIDNFSEDKTVQIAKEYTKNVVQYKNPGYIEHPDVVKFAISQITTEWAFWARTDEIPPITLLKKIEEIASSNICDVVQVSRLNILFGHQSKSWGKDYQNAFFKIKALDFTKNALYENKFIDGVTTLKLPSIKELSLWHFSNYDVVNYTNANNRYSSISARNVIMQRANNSDRFSNSLELSKVIAKSLVGKFQASRRLTLLRIILNPWMRFIWHYFIRGGIKSGWTGFVTSYLMMMEQTLTELKIWELENNILKERIDSYYDELKTEIIAGKVPELKREPFK